MAEDLHLFAYHLFAKHADSKSINMKDVVLCGSFVTFEW